MSENNASTDRRLTENGRLTETEGCRHLNVHAVEWAWSRAMGRLPGTQLLVLLAIAKHVGKGTDTCTPGHRHLAYEAGVSVSSVERAVPALEAAGWIKTEHRGRKKGGGRSSDQYWLLGYFPAKVTDNPVDKVHLSPQGDGKGGVVTPQFEGTFPRTVAGDRSTEAGSTKEPAAATSSTADQVRLSTASTPRSIVVAKAGCSDAEADQIIEAVKREKADRGQEIRSISGLLKHMPADELLSRLPAARRNPHGRSCNCSVHPAPPPETADDPEAYMRYCAEWVCPRHGRAAA